jgi:UDP-glucose 4-epimerase
MVFIIACYAKIMHILVTGGAGYIGSHTLVELLNQGHTAVVIDNLRNSSKEALARVKSITGKAVPLYTFDLENTEKLRDVFNDHSFDAVIHFAGLKAVGESVQKPLLYYRTNIDATLSLLEAMDEFDVRKLVFSSSATVYGSAPTPYSESSPTGQGITSPYGQTKYMVEQIIADAALANPDNKFTVLRYFNPIGAHESGLIGEDPRGIPNNLMPLISQVALGQREKLSIFGNDYPTPDGTCIRDYLHVVDLANGHVTALEHLRPGVERYNLGSGKGTSVLELVNTFIATTRQAIPYEFAPRREGDLPEFYADPRKANNILGWKAEKTIEDMCLDTWKWLDMNPNGYS